MLSEAKKLKVAQSVIDLALIAGRHPYSVLDGMINILEPDIEKGKLIYKDVQLIIKSRSKELPFSL